MKSIRFLVLLSLLLPAAVYSQDVKRLTLDIKNIKDDSGFCGNVYLNTEDDITQRFLCENGNVEIYFFEETLTSRSFITIRQDENGIANVDLDCLLGFKAPIKLPKLSIEVKEFKSVPLPTELSEVLKLYPSRNGESKLKPDLNECASYFPKSICKSDNNYTEYLPKWFSWNLKRLQESVLSHKYPNDVYRFTWTSLSCFYEYDPYSVRIEVQDDGSAVMFCNYYDNKDNNKCKVYLDVIALPPQSFEQFLQRINAIDLRGDTFTSDIEKHSVFYALEASINGQYHVMFRGDGEDEGMEELRRFLWDLSGLGENKIVHKRQRIE